MAVFDQEILNEVKQAARRMRTQVKNSYEKKITFLPLIQPYGSLSPYKLKNEDHTFFKPADEHLQRGEIIEKCCNILNDLDYKNEAAFVKHFFIQNQKFIDDFIRLNKEYDELLRNAKEKESLTEAELRTLEQKREELSKLQSSIRDTALAIFNDANQISDTAENLHFAFAAILVTACALGGLGLLGVLAPAVAAGLYTTLIDAIPAIIGVTLTMLLFIPAVFSEIPRDPFTQQNEAMLISLCCLATVIMTYELWNIMFPAILSAIPPLSIGMGVIAGVGLLAAGITKFFAARYEAESDQKFEEKLDLALREHFDPSPDEDDQDRDPSNVAPAAP